MDYLFETHTVVVASYTLQECEQVFLSKFPEKLVILHQFLADIEYELFNIPTQHLRC
jgi:hypothetical protein